MTRIAGKSLLFSLLLALCTLAPAWAQPYFERSQVIQNPRPNPESGFGEDVDVDGEWMVSPCEKLVYAGTSGSSTVNNYRCGAAAARPSGVCGQRRATDQTQTRGVVSGSLHRRLPRIRRQLPLPRFLLLGQ